MAESDPSFQVIEDSRRISRSADADNRTNALTNSGLMHSYEIATAESGGKAALHMSISQLQKDIRKKDVEIKSLRTEVRALRKEKETLHEKCEEHENVHRENKRLLELNSKLAHDYEQATGISANVVRKGLPTRSTSPAFKANIEVKKTESRSSPSQDHRVPSPARDSSRGVHATASSSIEIQNLSSQLLDKSSDENSPETQKKFKDFVDIVSDKIHTNLHLKQIQDEQENRIGSLIVTLQFVLEFFLLLKQFVCNSDDEGDDFPTRLLHLVNHSGNTECDAHDLEATWRLIVWKVNSDIGNPISPAVQRLEDVYAWYSAYKIKEVPPLECKWDRFYASMCSAFGLEESSGLATSILGDEANQSPETSSSESSLAASIPPEELWRLRSIILSLVERYADLRRSLSRLQKIHMEDNVDDDMYLPQKDALETYDLGKLMLSMSSVIESLTQRINVLEAERAEQEGTVHPGSKFVSTPADLSASQQQDVFLPEGMRPVPGTFGQGLSRAEMVGQTRTAFRPVNHPPPVNTGALPVVAPRLPQGIFHGIKGPLPHRQLTIINDASQHTRSKSDSSLAYEEGTKQTTLQDLKTTRPNSFGTGADFPGNKVRRSPPVARFSKEDYTQNGTEHDIFFLDGGDSDDDYEVRGPPDTPPQVRAKNFKGASNQSTSESNWGAGARRKYELDDPYQQKVLGGAVKPPSPLFSGKPSPIHGAAIAKSSHPIYNQVQQCTSDNVNTQQDMLLPTSVSWSTLQLRDGGIRSPTLEDMNPYSTSMAMAGQSLETRECPVCYEQFPLSEPEGAIYDHVQLHFDKDSPDMRVRSRATPKHGKDGMDNPMTTHNVKAEDVLAKKDMIVDRQCPVCLQTFPQNVPMVNVYSHINLHFDPEEFEVINDK